MRPVIAHLKRTTAALGVVSLALVAACESPTEAPTVDATAQFARGGGGPSVTLAAPAEGAQGSINLLVSITGSGFDNGSNAVWLRGGSPAAGVVTNQTTFVSKSELVADITIDAAALETLYDVEVTTKRGKKGVGVELFSVKKPGEVAVQYQIIPSANPDAAVRAASENDVLAGSLAGIAALFDLQGNATQLPVFLSQWSGVRALSRTAKYAVGGDNDGVGNDQPLIWNLTGASTTVARPSRAAGLPPGGSTVPLSVNDAGTVVGFSYVTDDRSYPTVWSPDGSGGWAGAVLEELSGTVWSIANDVNDDGDIVGYIETNDGVFHPVLWTSNGDGTHTVTDLSPGVSSTARQDVLVVSERAPDGSLLAGGYDRMIGESRATQWVVDAVNGVTTALHRAPERSGGVRAISPNGDMLVGDGQIWDRSRDTVLSLGQFGSNCNVWGRVFDSTGRLYGSGERSTRGSNCSQNGKNVETVGAVWNRIGG